MVGGNQRKERRKNLQTILGHETGITVQDPNSGMVDLRGTIEFRDQAPGQNRGYYIKGSDIQVPLKRAVVSPALRVIIYAEPNTMSKYREALV